MYNKMELLAEPEFIGSSSNKAVMESEISLDGTKTKKMKIEGTAIVCDIPGINGRAYPKTILDREAKAYTKKYIARGRSASELNHPRLTSTGEGKDYSVFEINLSKVCAIIEQLYFPVGSNEMYCKMRVVEQHPAGQMLYALINDGYVPGYSLRGAGSVVQGRKYLEVADDYKLITVDVVGNPSFDDKALISSMFESVRNGNYNIFTEAVDVAAKEFVNSIEKGCRTIDGWGNINKKAALSFLESINSGSGLI